MALSTLLKLIKIIVNVAVGGASLAAFIGGIWALLSGVGALVAYVTIWVGWKPGMWSMTSLFGVVDDPTYAGVALGFLYSLLVAAGIVYFAVMLLAPLGASVVAMFRKDAHS